jgi:acetyl-CoA carboxylase biotin carboxyl carrier protein
MWKLRAALAAEATLTRVIMAPRGKTKSASSAAKSAAKASGSSGSSEPGASHSDIVETVRGLAAIVAEHGLSEIIVDLPEATLTLRRGVTGSVASAPTPPAFPVSMALPAAPAAPAAAAPPPAAAAVVDDKAHVVTSPFVGTFYRKPNPDSSVYVQLGDKVSRGQVLCIIEAMKLMNEIEADVAGTIVGILVEDGSTVEYGQPLFKIS